MKDHERPSQRPVLMFVVGCPTVGGGYSVKEVGTLVGFGAAIAVGHAGVSEESRSEVLRSWRGRRHSVTCQLAFAIGRMKTTEPELGEQHIGYTYAWTAVGLPRQA